MSESQRKTFIALAIVVFVGFGGLAAVLLSGGVAEVPEDAVMSVAELEAEAERLLALGDAVEGERLVNRAYECHACHVSGNALIAPMFADLVEHANEREVLSPAAYIYEAIVNPGVYLVGDYNNSMPNNYRARLSDEELGSMIAYLLETYVRP